MVGQAFVRPVPRVVGAGWTGPDGIGCVVDDTQVYELQPVCSAEELALGQDVHIFYADGEVGLSDSNKTLECHRRCHNTGFRPEDGHPPDRHPRGAGKLCVGPVGGQGPWNAVHHEEAGPIRGEAGALVQRTARDEGVRNGILKRLLRGGGGNLVGHAQGEVWDGFGPLHHVPPLKKVLGPHPYSVRYVGRVGVRRQLFRVKHDVQDGPSLVGHEIAVRDPEHGREFQFVGVEADVHQPLPVGQQLQGETSLPHRLLVERTGKSSEVLLGKRGGICCGERCRHATGKVTKTPSDDFASDIPRQTREQFHVTAELRRHRGNGCQV